METVLVPYSSGQNTAKIWAAVIGTDQTPAGRSLQLLPDNLRIPLPDNGWKPITAGGKLAQDHRRNYVQTIQIDGLQPQRNYRVVSNGALADFRTTRLSLPPIGAKPFNILLGSCFYLGNDKQGQAGRLARKVQRDFRFDLKILCGDQVYLDILAGFPAFLLPAGQQRLAKRFLEKYIKTWSQNPGFQNLLDNGATYFTADDHEFWNNYPNPATAISFTWTKGGRRKWEEVARGLFEEFQSEAPQIAGRPHSFEVGRLRFFIADTRVFRQRGEKELMDPQDFQKLLQWVRSLDRPGVLVLGQPIFAEPANPFRRRFFDRKLSNYEQYHDLVRALAVSRWSVMVLTGDVHFGRVAECRLRTGAKLVEVISSPLSLVNAIVGGSSEKAPGTFPPAPGIPKHGVRTLYDTPERNFATLHITERPADIEVLVRYWFPQRTAASQQVSETVGPVRLPLA